MDEESLPIIPREKESHLTAKQHAMLRPTGTTEQEEAEERQIGHAISIMREKYWEPTVNQRPELHTEANHGEQM